MIYLDTSFLAPLFREEATSTKVAAFLARQSVGTLVVSKWASVEFASLVSRDARMGALTVAQGRKLIAEFDAMVADALLVLTPTANDFTLAQQYVANFPPNCAHRTHCIWRWHTTTIPHLLPRWMRECCLPRRS